ncbi:hypothetical protein IZY60_11540 [Lutibacter sp. B2]|nr:hypothetical protein [Lutibacter sp. B2]
MIIIIGRSEMMIGGEHYFDNSIYAYEIENSFEKFIEKISVNTKYFSTGRDAIYSLVESIEINRIWLPNYLCRSIYIPIHCTKKEIVFYDVDEKLKINIDFLDKVKENDCIFLINYFGLVQKDIYQKIGNKKAVVISDITHLLLNYNSFAYVMSNSNYVICSLRKLGPFPDGAFIGSKENKLNLTQKNCRYEFAYLRAGAFISRGYSKFNDFNNDENYEVLIRAEKLLNETLDFGYKMSYITENILKRHNYFKVVHKTKENINVFVEYFNNDKKCEILNKKEISQFIIILFKSQYTRDKVKYELSHANIFCPIHWDTLWMNEEHINSKKLISIPCDYRYSKNNMKNIADKINCILEEIK